MQRDEISHTTVSLSLSQGGFLDLVSCECLANGIRLSGGLRVILLINKFKKLVKEKPN